MTSIFDTLDAVICAIGNVLYQPWCVPLILLAAGIWFTIKSGCMQIKFLKESFRVIMDKPESKDGISSFGALMVSTASRVGTGNIIGVSTALCMGGPGAVFWMWVTAFLGGAAAFVESTLAQIYKRKDSDGSAFGGPAFYMETALHQRWMGVAFSIIIILIYSLGYNLLASYNLQSTFSAFSFYNESSTPMIIGIILMVLFGIIVIGGAKRLIRVTELLVPVMGVLYVIVSIFVLLTHLGNVPAMFGMIFRGAFDFKAIFGGFSGSCIMWGIKRGLYSNEAGMGSAPNAAAKADVSHPVKQGLVQMLSVFLDTLVICTATAFMCLSSGIVPTADAAGAAYVQTSMQAALGSFGPVFLCIAMSLFAFTTLIGNYSYCEGCLEFIMNRAATKTELIVFRVYASIVVGVGAVATAGLVWDLADTLQALAVLFNIPAILILGGVAMKCLKDYDDQRKEGKEPVFKAASIGLKEDTDFWK